MQHTDRFASCSYADYLARNRNAREAAEIFRRESDDDVSQDDRDELARLQMRDAERGGDE
jgi:hypothetical protein